ncbi:hypothetical protein [Halobacteriovorax sp. JY17]|uniref:hypothetical protein n=1 Tax=Halobacteriovorax sp. JY17 TaxID=2014617 RepID=UPI000C5BCA0B|nr:hypothetical protein [Halobacteriovorax sp. JY17]PIK15986.1 MAG: hypothetical protein CES88_04455 [Halobacteriovorax sp. JY17]
MTYLQELSSILNNYLDEKSHLSLNSLSKNMDVPETSLRRIKKLELKRMPKNDTVLKVLSYVYKTEDLYTLRAKLNPLGLGNYLTEEFLLSDSCSKLDVKLIDDSVRDQTSYLVFKLASNSCGTSKEEIIRLFGKTGEDALSNLIRDELVTCSEGAVKSTIDTFKVSHEYFIRNFKAVSNFIKVESQEETPNLYYNLSESVNAQAATKIHRIQQKALREIANLLNSNESRGDIPLFVLSAIDTLK